MTVAATLPTNSQTHAVTCVPVYRTMGVCWNKKMTNISIRTSNTTKTILEMAIGKMRTHLNLQIYPSFAAITMFKFASTVIGTAFGINARPKRWERRDRGQTDLAGTSQGPWRAWPKLVHMALRRRNSMILIWGTYFDILGWCSTILQHLGSVIFQCVIKPIVRVKRL